MGLKTISSRRNVTADQFAYFIGRKYERTKKQGARTDLTSRQNDGKFHAADRVAEQHGIAPRTVERAASFANDVDAIADRIGHAARTELLSGSTGATRAEVAEAAEIVREKGRGTSFSFSSAKEALDWARAEKSKKSNENRVARIEKIAEIAKGNAELSIKAKYPVVYADPPWRYDFSATTSREIENHYPTMTIEEICALPVADIVTDDAVLFMWATVPKLEESLKVIEAWGFNYRSSFAWVKDKIGMGYWARNQHELLLVAVRGRFPPPHESVRVSSIIHGDRTKHSAKPESTYEIIESYFPSLPKIELFCRSPRNGWSVWGNQSEAA